MPKPSYEDLKKRLKKLEKENTDLKVLLDDNPETDLRMAEKDLKEIFNLSLDMICIAGMDGYFKKVNPAFIKNLGFSEQELLSKPFYDFIHPDDVEDTIRIVKEKLQKGEPAIHFINRYRRSDGKYIWLSWHTRPIMEHKLLYAIARDITMFKQAEETLRKSEAMLQSIFRSAPVGIGLVSNRVLLWINERMTEMTGYTAEELVGQGSRILYPSDEEFEIVGTKKYNQIKEKGTGTVETKWKKKDGTLIDILLSSTPLDQNDLSSGVTFTALDITEKKKTESALIVSEAKYRALYDSSPDGILIADIKKMKFLYANPAICSMLGYTEEEILKLGVMDIHPKGALKRAKKDFHDLAKGDKIVSTDLLILRKDGTEFYADISARKVTIDEIECNIGFFRDVTERKHSEEALKDSELRYRSIVQSSPLGMHMYGLDDNKDLIFIGSNPAADKILGVDNSQFLFKSIERAFPSLKDTEVPKKYKQVAKSGKPWQTHQIEYEDDRIAGAYEVYAFQTIPGHMVAMFLDTTERKQVEDELEQTKALLAAAIESSPAGILIADAPDVNIRIANAAALGIRGKIKQPLINIPAKLHPKRWQAYYPDGNAYKPEDLPLSRAVLNGETIQNVEMIIKRPDGEKRWILGNAAPVKDHDGNIVAGVVVFPDITELKRSEEAFKVQQAYLERLIESAPEAIVLLDNNEVIMQVNQEFTNMFGYTFEEAVGKSTYELIATGELSEEAEKFSKFISKRQVLNVETKRRNKDGHLVDVSILASPITHEGKQMGIYAIYRDISDRKKSEDEKQKLEEQLFQSQKMESIGRLAGGVAHDFNNILAGIMGYAELLKLQFDNPDTPEGQASEVILESAERASDLTGQLLGFARKGKFHPQPVRINDIIKQTLKVSERIFEKKIEIKLNLNNRIETVDADINQLNQVFTNLFINAKDAMPDGGELSIVSDNIDLDKNYTQQIPELKTGSYVIVSITDNGTGMSKEICDHIFEPFFTTKGEGKGTGLGLATVYGIIKNHNGHISVYSEPGLGTSFHLYFPVSGKKVKTAKKAKKLVKGSGTILVVDDEPNVRNLAKYLLGDLGYNVISANDGNEAVDLYKKIGESIDLVILDMIMPNLAGKETFAALRKIDPGIKVLLSSGYSQNGAASDILTDGALGFIQKPFRVELISKMISEALKK